MPPIAPIPLPARFRSQVELTIHGGYLATAGVLQADPIAKVHIVTVKRRFPDPLGADRTPRTASPTDAPQGLRSGPAQRLSGSRGRSASPVSAAPRRSAMAGMSPPSLPPRAGGGGGVGVTISARTVGSTKAKYFTARPAFEETISFQVTENSTLTSLAAASAGDTASAGTAAAGSRAESVEDAIVITMEDATGGGDRFYGEAYCPFSPHCPSTVPPSAPVRVMLRPRNVADPSDPLFHKDLATLSALRLDDFGFLNVSWTVTLIPHGGAMMKARTEPSAGPPPAFPIGLTLHARWQAPLAYARQPQSHFTAAAAFDRSSTAERFVFPPAPVDPGVGGGAGHSGKGVVVFESGGEAGYGAAQGMPLQPLFLTIRSASQLPSAVTVHLSVQNAELGSHEVAVDLPLPALTTPDAFDRDLRWAAPVRTTHGNDLGLLFARVRLSRRPLEGNTPPCTDANCPLVNDPAHQEAFTHTAKDWTAGAAAHAVVAPYPLPHAPYGAYQPLLWESAEHIAMAAERSWKRGVIWDAQPTAEHVRHVFDVLMGRSQLDAGVANVAAMFSGRSLAAELTTADLKDFLVACAFNARGLSVVEAARFCFVALRRDVEDAVAADEIHYLFTHSLVGRTVDMSAGELRRWVTDLIGDLPAIRYTDFTDYVLNNEALWSDLGIPVYPDATVSSAQHRHHYYDAASGLASTSPAAVAGQGLHPLMNDGARGLGQPGDPPASVTGAGAVVGAPPTTAPYAPPPPLPGSAAHTNGGEAAATDVWRTFVVRVPATGKTFSVTAHATDTVGEVKRMVEESTGIRVDRQSWHLNGESPLDNRAVIGATTLGIPPALKTAKEAEVWIREMEERVSLWFLYKTKKYQETFPITEKVLRVRAHTQRWTRLPLSRCVLKLRGAGGLSTVLQDRHPLAFYQPMDGDVVEISQE